MKSGPAFSIRLPLVTACLPVAFAVNPLATAGELVISDKSPAASVERNEPIGFFPEFPLIYRGGSGAFVQELAATGIVHFQGVAGESNYDSISNTEFRRFRWGGRIRFGENFLFSGNANFDPEEVNPFYRDLSQVYLSWSPYGNDRKAMERFLVSAGKIKPRFTREYTTSAKKIRTFERSLLVNQFAPSKATGLWVGGSEDRWSYVVAGLSGDDVPEFSEFRNGFLGLAKVGYDFAENANAGLDYMVGTSGQEITAPIDCAVSLSTEWKTEYEGGPLSLVTDLLFSSGRDADLGDAWGIVVMPGWKLTDKLELVARYQFAHANSDGGLRLQKRYERPVSGPGGERGDRYHAGWLGLNCYLDEHKLKLMTGVEYSRMSGPADFSAWTWFSGVRLYF